MTALENAEATTTRVTEETNELNDISEENSPELKNAIEDFIEGKGTGKPSREVCVTLIHQYTPIGGKIAEHIHDPEVKSLSFMPYGNELITAINPIFIGRESITLPISLNGSSIDVIFDRN